MPESGFRHAGDNPKSGSRPPIAVEIAVTDEPKCSMIRRFEQLASSPPRLGKTFQTRVLPHEARRFSIPPKILEAVRRQRRVAVVVIGRSPSHDRPGIVPPCLRGRSRRRVGAYGDAHSDPAGSARGRAPSMMEAAVNLVSRNLYRPDCRYPSAACRRQANLNRHRP
jgi:hypothetical protein